MNTFDTMIHIKRYNAAYMEIPKNASTSIKIALARTIGKGEFGVDIHAKEREVFDYISTDSGDNRIFRFAFVRNPTDRLMSFYFDKIMNDNADEERCKSMGMYKKMPFPEMVDVIIGTPPENLDVHIRPQKHFLVQKGRLVVDFIGRCERIEEDWFTIRAKTGISGKLTKTNATNEAPVFLRDLSFQRIQNYYFDDYKFLRYDKRSDFERFCATRNI